MWPGQASAAFCWGLGCSPDCSWCWSSSLGVSLTPSLVSPQRSAPLGPQPCCPGRGAEQWPGSAPLFLAVVSRGLAPP